MSSATPWKVEGDYFEGCNCETACQCVFLSAPDMGHCDLTSAWHIEKGHFETTSLDGLNVVGVFHSPGHMVTGPKWIAALYLDERATPEQAEALGKIFSGQAGGHPAVLAGFIGEVKGVRSAPIHFETKGRWRRVRVPTILDMEIEGVQGMQPDQEARIVNPSLGVTPGFDLIVAKSTKLTYTDHGFDWDNTGKNGFYSRFSYGP